MSARTPQPLPPPIAPVPRGGERAQASVDGPPRPVDLPLSFAQQRLWFVDQLEGGALYHVPIALRVRGRLRVPVLHRVLDEVVRRHEALRTVFRGEGGRPRQVILPPAHVPVPLVDLAELPAARRGAAARAQIEEASWRPFDLARGPLLRVGLWRLSAAEHLLLFAMHHIVSDGWSLGVLVREVGALYLAFAAGRPSPLPELPLQYADFAVWQRGWLDGGVPGAAAPAASVARQQLAFWRGQLAGAPARLELPGDRQRSGPPDHRSGGVAVTVEAALARQVATLCRVERVTPFMILLAAFGLLLGRSAGQPEVVVGTPIANRNRREVEGLIGFFVNTLPLRLTADPQAAFRAIVKRTKQVTLAAFMHQDLPFERLVEELGGERAAGRSPVFQVLFGVQNAPVAPLAVPGLALDPVTVEPGEIPFDLVLVLAERGGAFAGKLDFAADLFDRVTIARLFARYSALLGAALAAPERPVGELPWLLPGEGDQLLREWNDSTSDYPRQASVGELFARQARTAPDAVAIVETAEEEGSEGAEGAGAAAGRAAAGAAGRGEDARARRGGGAGGGGSRHWSYGWLDAASGAVALHLRRLGMRRGARVGVAMERSADLVAALLGVLRAGAAYVPLDASHPAERLAYQLADTGAALVLVHARTRAALADLGRSASCAAAEAPGALETAAGSAAAPWRLVDLGSLLPGTGPADGAAPSPAAAESGGPLPVGAAPGGAAEGGTWPGRGTPPENRDLPEPVTAGDLAYVIYTSGSTGRPKGVAVAHQAIVRLVRGSDYVRLAADDRVGHASNVSFDAATFEIWGPLLSGAAVVVVPREVVLSPAALAARLAADGVSALFLTTALFNQVAGHEPAAFGGLRHLLTGGEAADPGAMARVLAAGAPPRRLLHVYGPTESTTFATWHHVQAGGRSPGPSSGAASEAGPAGWRGAAANSPGAPVVASAAAGGPPAPPLAAPIGRPLANTTVYVLDAGGRLLPPGVVGELHLGGEGLAQGYFARPELTAERFVPDPWSAAPGGRLYRTGDRVRWRREGALDFAGRADGQVKIRGFRVEPGEVEAALATHPGVRECAVVARRPAPLEPAAPGGGGAFAGARVGGEVRLVAYVVPAAGARPSADELRAHLKRSLPEFMVPSSYVTLAALPLTANGKLDRAALPEPEAPAERGARHVAPRTPIEELLAGIWEEVLGQGGIGVNDDFFALGGHSLVATQVTARLRQALGVELPLRRLFDTPTIAQLAREVEELRRQQPPAGGGAPAPLRGFGRRGGLPPAAGRDGSLTALGEGAPCAPLDRSAPLPVSFSQERLWFLQQLEPGSAAYNMPVEVELAGALRVELLAAAVTAVVRRQESLRTTFEAAAGGLRQRIAPPPFAPSTGSPLSMPLADLSALPAAAARGEARRLQAQHAAQRFDLARGPLFALLLVRLGAGLHHALLNLHHTIADGWSIDVLVRELGELYAAGAEGRPARLPALRLQYADFAQWQRRFLEEEAAAAGLAYWEAHLGGEAARAELPTDRPRPAVQTFRGARRQLALPPELTARLRAFGRAEGLTLFMTLLAAAQALIARHSGEPDVAVGAPVAGRRWVETEGLIGCFLNTLVLRTDTSGRPSFRALAARVRTVTLDAYAHQDVPFEAVLGRLGVQRDLARAPLFQVLFNLLSLRAPGLSLPGLELRALAPPEVPSKLDMTFYLSDAGAAAGIDLLYNADLFDEAHMAEVLAQLAALLDQAVVEPDRPVAHLSLVSGWARSVLPDPAAEIRESAHPTVAHFFRRLETAHSERAAVCFRQETWTFARLGSRARELGSAALAASAMIGVSGTSGVPPPVVAVAGPRCPDLIAGILGVFLSGGVLLTLDRTLPPARLRLMIEAAKPRCLLYIGPPRAEDAWLWELGSPAVVHVAPGAPTGPGDGDLSDETVPSPGPGPDDPAYVFFTSGTTGRPKAVLGRQKGLSHFVTWQRETFGIGAGDRVAQLMGLSFDAVLRDIFLALTSGATLCLPDEDESSPERLLPWVRERAVTVLHTVPSLAGAWLAAVDGRPLPTGERPAPSALRCTFFVGEPLLDQVVGRWRAAFSRTAVINLYGPTETTLTKCFYRVPDPPVLRVQPAGVPLPETQALVLARLGRRGGLRSPDGGEDGNGDESGGEGPGERGGLLLCGIGEAGEIVLRTPFRTLGYLDLPAENRARFRPNPFRPPEPLPPGGLFQPLPPAADLLYFTGDRGRYRPDGTLEILGRLDAQVKLRGVRIEPAEIRVCLGRHEAVLESAVVLRNDGDGGDEGGGGAGSGEQRLVAYVVLRPGTVLDPEVLRRHLRRELPEVMIPAVFVALDALPLTPNGKLDSRALPAPVRQGGEQRGLRNPVEEIVAGLWAELLGRPHVGPDDNFFELGGHSLTGARLISRLRQTLAADLPLRALFEAPTVARLAAEIERLRRGGAAREPRTIASFREERGSPPPLSFAQERYWANRHLEARTVASTIPLLMHLAGALDRICLRRALAAAVERHELLRTSFRDGPQGAVQVIHPTVPVVLREIDLSRLTPPARTAEMQRLGILDGRRHFDYERPPLFRLTLFRFAAEEHVLLFTIHHVALDWLAGAVLLREVSALYHAFHTGQPSPLPPPAAQFQDFARWQRRLSLEEQQASQVTFWREHLRGAVPIDLTAGRPRPARQTFAAGLEPFVVPAELERQLDAFSSRHGVTLFMTLLAAFKALLHVETGSDDLVVPCTFANRNQIEAESLVGNLATGLPLRTRLTGVRTFPELLRRVREVVLLAHEHPDIYYEPVVAGLGFLEEGDRGGLTTFRIQFQLMKMPVAMADGSLLRVTQLPLDTGKIRMDLSLFLYQSERLTGRFRYNRDVLDAARVGGMLDRYLRILAAVAADPERPLAELPLAPEAPLPPQEEKALAGALQGAAAQEI